MKSLNSNEEILEIFRSDKNIVFYIGDESCSVCRDLYPKVESIEGNYDKLEFYRIDYSKNLGVMGELSVFTMPTIIGKIDGREFLRESRFISVKDLVDQLDRYHSFLEGDE